MEGIPWTMVSSVTVYALEMKTDAIFTADRWLARSASADRFLRTPSTSVKSHDFVTILLTVCFECLQWGILLTTEQIDKT